MTLDGIKTKGGALESLRDKKVGDQNQIIYLGLLKKFPAQEFQFEKSSLLPLPNNSLLEPPIRQKL